MFVFLLKPRKQQEAVNKVNNVKFCFCLQMVEYLFFYRSQESNRRWSNRSAAVTDRLRLQPFWGLKHFSTNSKANASIFAMFAWLAIFAIFAIFSIYPIFAISPISARFAIFKSPTIGNQTRFAINSIYLYSCDLLVWDSSGLTSSIQILPYQIIRCSIFVSCIYCEVSDDSLHHFLVFVCNWVWPWIS